MSAAEPAGAAEPVESSEPTEPTEPVAATPWHTLDRATLKVTALFMLGAAIGAGVPTAIGIASGTSLGVALAWVLPGAAVLIAGAVVADYLRWRKTRYRVLPERMELHKGILFTQRRSLGRERIRTVDLSANPLYRIFGLVKVSVGTGEQGGGSGASSQQTIVLDPVSKNAGEHLRAVLLDRDVVAAEGVSHGRIATWDPAWTRYAPMSFWTFVFPGIIIGGAFQVSGWFGADGLPIEVGRDVVDRLGPWPSLIAGVVGLLVVGVVLSVVFVVEGWWNYRLDREARGTLRVQRGLLTTRSVSFEEQRIRGVDIVEPLGVRLAGAARVEVVATGLKTSDDAKTEASTLVPAAPYRVAASVVGRVLGRVPAGDLTTHPRSARSRRLRWAGFASLGVVAAVAVAEAWWSLPVFWLSVTVVVAVVAVAGLFVVAVDAYRNLGHAIDGDFLVARCGSIRRSTVLLQRQGIIGWQLKQSVFQRRAGLMTLVATTAAGRGNYAVIDADEHEVLDLADDAVPELLRPFLVRAEATLSPSETTGWPR